MSESDYQNFAKKFFTLFFSFASKHCQSVHIQIVRLDFLECKQEGISFGLLEAVHNLSPMTFAP